MSDLLSRALSDVQALTPKLAPLSDPLYKLGEAMLDCWSRRGKVLTAGNGGSAADAIHLAEELSVRFAKKRKALAAFSLLDGSVLTCAGNDFGFESIFVRQIEALANPGDILVVFTTSGNSENIIHALQTAKKQGVLTAGFLGKGGGKAKPLCDIDLTIPSEVTHRIQEAHLILYHTLCEWIDERVD